MPFRNVFTHPGTMDCGPRPGLAIYDSESEAKRAGVRSRLYAWTEEVHRFKFSTDSESGHFEAVSFREAKMLLAALVTGSDGGWGWVDDLDGTRFEI